MYKELQAMAYLSICLKLDKLRSQYDKDAEILKGADYGALNVDKCPAAIEQK